MPAALARGDHVDHLDALAREPMVVQHPSGALFVSGYGEPGPKLWKSTDRGATWLRVNVGSESDGAIGNSDVDLAVARDGTLYFVTMGYDREKDEGTHIAVGVSKDVGATWRWTMLSKARFDDRPWVAVAPDGTAHVIWNDGSGVGHSISRDGGVHWTQLERVYPKGGSSHLAVGPHGEVAVRITPMSASGNKLDPGVDLIAVSTDGGSHWVIDPAPGSREWITAPTDSAVVPRWVEPLAWDETGALYSLWTNRAGLWIARSADLGKTWTTWSLSHSATLLYFPYLIARGRGKLAATWFSGENESLAAHVGLIEMGERGSAPRLIEAPTFEPESWTWGMVGGKRVRDSAGEYLALVLLRDGSIGVVSPLQDRGAERYGFTWWTFVGGTQP